jgi:hypothetical protein
MTEQTNNNARVVARVEVKLKKAHTHAGEDKAPGDTIEVTPKQKNRLTERGII